MLLTFLHHAPPPPGPVAELQGVALLYLGPLLEAAHQLVAQPVAVVHPLHRALVVTRLQAGDRFGEQDDEALPPECKSVQRLLIYFSK